MADVVFSWMLMSTAEADGIPLLLRPLVRLIRRRLVSGFIEGVTIDDAARRWVTIVCERRLADPNTTEAERVNIAAFARQGDVLFP